MEDLPDYLQTASTGDLDRAERPLRLALAVLEDRTRRAVQTAGAPAAQGQEDRLLDMQAVAKLLGVPVDRAYDLGRQRAFPVVAIGKYRRVRLSAIRAFIKANKANEGA